MPGLLSQGPCVSLTGLGPRSVCISVLILWCCLEKCCYLSADIHLLTGLMCSKYCCAGKKQGELLELILPWNTITSDHSPSEMEWGITQHFPLFSCNYLSFCPACYGKPVTNMLSLGVCILLSQKIFFLIMKHRRFCGKKKIFASFTFNEQETVWKLLSELLGKKI